MCSSHHSEDSYIREIEKLKLQINHLKIELRFQQIENAKLRFVVKLAERDYQFDSKKYMEVK